MCAEACQTDAIPLHLRGKILSCPLTATITISSDGQITGCDPTARAWWGENGVPLEGRFFLELFQLDVRSETREERALQWEVLCEAAMEAPLALEANPHQGDGFTVRLFLARGDPESLFLARLEREEAQAEQPPEPVPAAPEAPSPPPSAPAPPPSLPGDGSASKIPGLWEVLEDAPTIGMFVIDFTAGSFRFSNGWKRMLGYAPHELPDAHETLIKLLHPEDSDATPDQSEQGAPESVRPYNVEFRMRHKAGHYVWVQSSGMQEFGPTGDLWRVTGFHTDITERKEMEEESLQNEDRFLTLIDRGKIPFFDLDLRTRKAFFSASFRKLLGYDAGDLENMPESFRRLLEAEEGRQQDLATVFAGGAAGRSSFVRELRLQMKEGGFINLQTQIVRITNRRGELLRVMGIETSGAPEQESTPKGATPAEALQASLEAINEAVLITDGQGLVTFFNGKASRLTGRKADEVLGVPLQEALPLLQGPDRQPAPSLADSVLSSGNPILFSREFALPRADASEPRAILVSCLPLRSGEDRILGAVVVFRDPDEMSLTPEELVRSNRMEALGLLAGGIAHDFNNLLTTIIGGISLAREMHEWEPLENSEKAGLSAKNLTRQLLMSARGKFTGRKVVHLEGLVRDCARLGTAGSPVKLEMLLAEELFPVAIDTGRMSQVFQNLVINSVQAMGDAGGALTIHGENAALAEGQIAGLAAGDYLKISVKDTGKGIPREIASRIFEPFFTTKKTGTGLGLSTVHAIVRDHDGQITVNSDVGVGTTFSVYLPKSDETAESDTRRRPSLKYGTGRILFMDDDEGIAELGAGMLARLDYTYDIARNGEEALALYRRYLQVDRPYDAVILDLTIVGGMGGEETLAKLLEMDPEVRAIVSSGYSTEETIDYYLKKGFVGVLSKPYRSEEMGKTLRQVLGIDPPPGEEEL